MPGPKRTNRIDVITSFEKALTNRQETPAQKANRLGVPLVPGRAPVRYDHNPVIAVCGECGHEVRSMDYRACPTSNCPFGSKVTLN
jgi:hypothetical protein